MRAAHMHRCLIALAMLLAGTAQAAPNDPYAGSSGSWGQAYRDQWGLPAIHWQAKLAARSPREVLVAVIDTGLDYYHPDLVDGNLYYNPGEVLNGRDDDANGYVDDLIGWNFVDGNGNPWDRAGHGTLVTGIIAATTGNGKGIAGMAPNARIMPLKVLNFIGHGHSSRVAEAIYYAASKGARIINLSLGGESPSKAILRAVDYAARNKVLIVVAAGNAGHEVAQPRYLDLPNVITVAATDTANRRAGFSNFGPAIDVSAPGVDILSLRARRTDVAYVAEVEGYKPEQGFIGKDAHYYRANGTSFAAPFVTGAAALILGRNPQLDPGSIKRMILQSAHDIGDPGVDQETGYGLLDLPAALKADAKHFVDARITGVGVINLNNQLFVRVTGIARADRFDKAWVEVGHGDKPGAWKRASGTITAPVALGVLEDLPADMFDAPGRWTLRLTVAHADGSRREARRTLDIN